MTTRIAHRASAAASSEASYDRDFYSWTLEQARALRERRFDRLDPANLAEEIESLGREQFNKLEGAFRVLIMHMLKWDHQPARRSRSWLLSIARQRLEIEDILVDNPSLKARQDEAIIRAYRKARIEAAKETDLAPEVFPETNPYSSEDIASRVFSL